VVDSGDDSLALPVRCSRGAGFGEDGCTSLNLGIGESCALVFASRMSCPMTLSVSWPCPFKGSSRRLGKLSATGDVGPHGQAGSERTHSHFRLLLLSKERACS
jgi:hypothetical protein